MPLMQTEKPSRRSGTSASSTQQLVSRRFQLPMWAAPFFRRLALPRHRSSIPVPARFTWTHPRRRTGATSIAYTLWTSPQATRNSAARSQSPGLSQAREMETTGAAMFHFRRRSSYSEQDCYFSTTLSTSHSPPTVTTVLTMDGCLLTTPLP